jgi:glycosyltransferase involved in cell wall biosynthesis
MITVYRNDDPDQFLAAFDSIRNQTHPAEEILVVVDGPVPEALDLVLTEVESHPIARLLRLGINQGRGIARHLGILEARNEWIAIMDADDLSVPTRFERQMAVAREVGADLVGGLIEEFRDEPGDLGVVRRVPEHHADILPFSRLKQPVNHVTILFRKSMYLKSGGYRSMKTMEDYDFLHRMLLSGAVFHNLQETLVHVRFSNEQYHRRHGWAYFKEELEVQQAMRRSGHIGWVRFMLNVVIRFTARMMPTSWLSLLYTRFLRDTRTISSVNETRSAIFDSQDQVSANRSA